MILKLPPELIIALAQELDLFQYSILRTANRFLYSSLPRIPRLPLSGIRNTLTKYLSEHRSIHFHVLSEKLILATRDICKESLIFLAKNNLTTAISTILSQHYNSNNLTVLNIGLKAQIARIICDTFVTAFCGNSNDSNHPFIPSPSKSQNQIVLSGIELDVLWRNHQHIINYFIKSAIITKPSSIHNNEICTGKSKSTIHESIKISKRLISSFFHCCCKLGFNIVVSKMLKTIIMLEESNINYSRLPLNPNLLIAGKSPLAVAVLNANPETVDILLSYSNLLIDPNLKTEDGMAPLHLAASLSSKKTGNLKTDLVKLFLDSKVVGSVDLNIRDDNNNWTPIFFAIREWESDHDTQIVDLFIQNPNTDLLARDLEAFTPLHCACVYGKTKLVERLLLSDSKNRQDLSSIDPNAVDIEGSTGLHFASRKNYADIVLLLLKDGRIDPNIKDYIHGRTPLHQAAVNGCLEAVQALMQDARVDLNVVDKSKHMTAYQLAKSKGHSSVVKQLKKSQR